MWSGFKSRNHPQQVAKHGAREDTDDRATLPAIFDPLHTEFRFTIDVAASKENTKCPRFFTREQDGLKQSWAGESVWCNPPYSGIREWLAKAIEETSTGTCERVVMLLPNNRAEQKWWQELIEPVRDRPNSRITTRFLPGRPRFGFPPDRPRPVKGDRPPFGLVVVVIKRAA